MTRAVTALILTLGAGAVRAEWQELAAAGDASPRMAYDTARVRFEPPYVTAWTRVVLPQSATLGNGVQYRSVTQKVAVDCAARVLGVTYSEFFGNRDAVGAPVFTDTRPRAEWALHRAPAGSNGERLIRALCTTPKPW
jgi:surface-adhesin protein E